MDSDRTESPKVSILAVDDTADNLRLLSSILTERGYEVRKAISGSMALRAVKATLPDLILLDINMPEMNGYEVCAQLKAEELTKEVPVIFISALDDALDKVKAFAVGGADYITKPFQAEEVVVRMENQLTIVRQQRELRQRTAQLETEIEARKRAEETERSRALKLRNHNQVLTELAKSPALHDGDLKAALEEITEASVQNIGIARASVWLYDKTKSKIQCLDLFEKERNLHSEGFELAETDYPSYFKALQENEAIAADDAHTDPRTREFSQSYLTPLGINSMLDIPIRIKGKTAGVICLEHVGATRHWMPEDMNFARSLADLVALALEARERKQAEEEVRLLLTIGLAISAAPDFDTALEVALQQVCETTKWIYGEAWIPTPDDSALICSPRWYGQRQGIDASVVAEIERFRAYSEVLTFLPGEEIPGKVWSTRQCQWITEFASIEDALLRLELATECGLKAAFGVPIVPIGNQPQQAEEYRSCLLSSKSPVLAVLVFFTFSTRPEDKRLSELVSVVATQSGTVVQQKKVQAEMKALFAAMTDVVVVRDVSGRCLNVMPTNTASLDKSPVEMIGKKLHNTLPTEIADLILQSILEAVSTQKTVEIEYCLLTMGKEIWLAETISPLSQETAILVARDITSRKQAEEALRLEREKSEQLLLNILPEPIANQLKENQGAIAEYFNEVTILFADIVGFTPMSARIAPSELVNLLNEIFSTFDELTEKHELEKIKTIGDAYMVVGGLPVPKDNSAEAIAEMALDMQAAIAQFQSKYSEQLQIRIGINTGSVVAGVIGVKKFIYDLWGDAVNVASRMESSGVPSKIQVTEETYERLKDRYAFEKRGQVAVKGRGEMTTYWLIGKALPKEKKL